MRVYQLLILILFSQVFSCSDPVKHRQVFPLSESPGPSDEDDPLKDSLKQVFLDNLYFAAEGTNVDSIRYSNRQQIIKVKQQRRNTAESRTAAETFADGDIEGTWHERGPDNEAGDMRVIDYVPSLDRFYAISSVGHLWKGSTAGDDWTLLNDDIDFENDFIKVLPHNGGTRIFAAYGTSSEDKVIRYSDDEGQTWTKGTGFDFYDHWGAGRRLYALSDNTTLYYLAHTWSGSPWGQLMQVYKSTDKGETYTQILETSVGYQNEEMDMWKPHDADSLFIIDNVAKEYYTITHNFGSGASTISSAVSFSGSSIADGGIHLSGRQNAVLNAYELFMCHDDNNRVYKTTTGSSWTLLGTASDNVWQKGWLADPNNDNLYVGSFQLNKSSDGASWEEQYTNWWEYYSTSKDSMHVDIMNLSYFEKSDGTPFIIICNHAGVHITYDSFHTTENLAWNALRVTTLYDQSTASDGFLYCGAQDKGTFVFNGNSQQNYSILSTMNTTTGDGMIGSFFNSDQSYFSMIQNGQFAVVPDRTTNSKTWYTIPGNHKSGWINPMVATPAFSDNKAYMAGGNLSGGNGCYLILMDVDISSGVSFNPTQFDYDFRANSNNGSSVIKAIGVASSDANRIYVATEDATFFYSENAGTSWTKSTASLPSTLRPWEIITSNTNADYVILSGTGFSNTGVYLSTDGGDNFTALSNSAPAATFYEIALDDSEQYLYAATSEGPYVYSFTNTQWYNLFGSSTPIVDFTSVDNIGNSTIRFGTYGRGVWDFELNNVALPVDLVEFNAKPISNQQVELDWITSSELNTSFFEVEHSNDGLNFNSIGIEPAVGNTQVEQEYNYIHSRPLPGVNFYRLRMVDQDNTAEYSPIRSAEIRPTDDNEFDLYPNPVKQQQRVTMLKSTSEVVRLQLFNTNGSLAFSKEIAEDGFSLPAKVGAGIYLYVISRNNNQILRQGKLMVTN